ncbi:MAG: cell division protein FtsQ/DivIB [Rickettsiales bacterium]|jgi:cell division protein FtsQ|nr:cell division protein FtsQ/DivIB [Rickettsiales bacterium]
MGTKEFFDSLRSFCLAGAAAAFAIYAAAEIRQNTVGSEALALDSLAVEFVGDPPMDEEDAAREVKDAMGTVEYGARLSGIDIGDALAKISALKWVGRASVSRAYPNELKVVVEPKKILAYMYLDGDYRPVDSEGNVVDMRAPSVSGLVVSGTGANERLVYMLDVLKKYPRIYSNLAGMQMVGGIRWNLVLYDMGGGLLIKLPDEDYESALAKIEAYDARHDMLKRQIAEIDVRDPDRLLVRPRRAK